MGPEEQRKDSFVAYAIVSVAASFPFLLWLIGIQMSARIARHLVDHVQTVALCFVVVCLGLAAICVKLETGGKIALRPITDYFIRGFVLLYALLPIGFAVFSLARMNEDPCGSGAFAPMLMVIPAAVGCGASVSSFYVLCAKIGTALLGLGVSGGLAGSVIATKTSSQRWRLFGWSFLAWLLLAGVSVLASSKACSISCGQALPYNGN